jgi:ferric-dicitrate binding protein FerR (iron transport regulator)
MPDKNQKEELFMRYFLGEIGEDELRELDACIAESTENRTLFFELKQISDSVRRSIWSEDEKEESWRRMHARIRGLSEERTPPIEARTPPVEERRKRRLPAFVRYAAVFAVALGAGIGIREFAGRKTADGERTVATACHEIRVERGGRGNTLILSDGSKVALNPATTFRYPASFGETERTVYLDGEAWFDVARDETRPFTVKLERQDITVLGTAFNVEAYSDEACSVVTLLSGSITLDAYGENGEPMSRMFLRPGQRARSDNKSGSVTIRNIDTATEEASRTKGRYTFRDETLAVIAGRLEKYYGVRIHIGNEQLRQMRFTGSFSKNRDIREVLQVMDHENSYTVKRVADEISITGKEYQH